MQISRQTDYALRILMALAATGGRMSVDEVARRYGISRNHLAKIAQHLQGEGYIVTIRGRHGGMELARAPAEINVGALVRKFETLDHFVDCFSRGGGCAVDGACGLKPVLAGALEAFLAHLDAIQLDRLVPDRHAFLARLAG